MIWVWPKSVGHETEESRSGLHPFLCSTTWLLGLYFETSEASEMFVYEFCLKNINIILKKLVGFSCNLHTGCINTTESKDF